MTISTILQGVKRRKKRLLLAGGVLCMLLLIVSLGNYIYVGRFEKYTIQQSDIPEKNLSVGIVFGAGISRTENRPYPNLQARLDVAAAALQKGYVQKLILSGDNRFVDYNEPDVMVAYLVEEKGIPREQLQPDYAGRSSYETCERAVKIFGLKKAVLFSAESHLPRAVFLCRSFGLESYGVASGAEANNATRREFMARNKAMLNVYIKGEKTVLGDPIPL